MSLTGRVQAAPSPSRFGPVTPANRRQEHSASPRPRFEAKEEVAKEEQAALIQQLQQRLVSKDQQLKESETSIQDLETRLDTEIKGHKDCDERIKKLERKSHERQPYLEELESRLESERNRLVETEKLVRELQQSSGRKGREAESQLNNLKGELYTAKQTRDELTSCAQLQHDCNVRERELGRNKLVITDLEFQLERSKQKHKSLEQEIDATKWRSIARDRLLLQYILQRKSLMSGYTNLCAMLEAIERLCNGIDEARPPQMDTEDSHELVARWKEVFDALQESDKAILDEVKVAAEKGAAEKMVETISTAHISPSQPEERSTTSTASAEAASGNNDSLLLEEVVRWICNKDLVVVEAQHQHDSSLLHEVVEWIHNKDLVLSRD